MGALLDAVAVGLAKRESVILEEVPRMADFSLWSIATEVALGGEPGDFMGAYGGSRNDAVATALEAWPVSDTFMKFAGQFKSELNAWEGTATELLSELNR